ncbi:MAG TPA: GntR family transcriptional regulator [Symbiobacteriaceae bacterium]|nr:GntR family transcriptional regulator [Symbiobacteriaceae bacterium]
MGKDAPIPLYYQIKARLLEAIENGQLKPGDRVMSERELTTQFGVSRMTARQALTELENQGYLYRVQGKGTFVATPKLEQPLAGLTSFTEDMRRRGLEPGARVLAAEEMVAGRRVARALGIGETTAVYKLERLRLAGGEPMALEAAHLPVVYVPGLLESGPMERSLYRILAEHYQIHLVRATQSLEAVPANAYEADMLHVKEGTPLLLLERIARDTADRPVEFVRSLYRGDRYRFTTELIRREEGP